MRSDDVEDLSVKSGSDSQEIAAFAHLSEWTDDQKMNVMFAPFRDRNAYPKAWEQKMKFWTHLIRITCRQNNDIIVDVKKLPQLFRRKRKLPICLETVFQEMIKSKKLQRISEFQRPSSSGWMSWGFDTFVKAPLSWSLSWVYRGQSAGDGQYVLIDILKEKANCLLERHYEREHSYTDCVLELSALFEQCQDLCKDMTSLRLILTQLEREHKVVVYRVNDTDVLVKFVKREAMSVSTVTEIDIGIFRIQKTRRKVEAQVEKLTDDVARFTEDIRDYLRRGLKRTALHALKKKKKTQKLIEQRLVTLDTLHDMLEKIQDTDSQKMILDAYSAGSSALKSYMQDKDLTLDRVDQVLDDMQEATDEQKEISDTIAGFSMDQGGVNDMDLEDELSELISGSGDAGGSRHVDESEEEDDGLLADKLLADLPDVPTFSPDKSGIPTAMLANAR